MAFRLTAVSPDGKHTYVITTKKSLQQEGATIYHNGKEMVDDPPTIIIEAEKLLRQDQSQRAKTTLENDDFKVILEEVKDED